MLMNLICFQAQFKMEVLGTVVLTNYTDRTYRIDDVDFEAKPNDTFEKDGKMITYATYMQQKYQVIVKDLNQPMLVSKANARQRRSGMPELIYLIPELCRTTGTQILHFFLPRWIFLIKYVLISRI